MNPVKLTKKQWVTLTLGMGRKGTLVHPVEMTLSADDVTAAAVAFVRETNNLTDPKFWLMDPVTNDDGSVTIIIHRGKNT